MGWGGAGGAAPWGSAGAGGSSSASSSSSASTGSLPSWWDERRAVAAARLNGLRYEVDTAIDFNYLKTPPKLLGATPPSQDSNFNGLVYQFPAVGETLCDAGSTPLTLIAEPRSSSWYVARKFSVVGPIASSQVIPLALDAGNAGGTVGTNYIYVNLFQATSPTKFQLLMGGTGLTASNTDLGTACQIGSSLCPAGPPVTVALVYYDFATDDTNGGELAVEFNDVEVLRLRSRDGGLDGMPQVPLGLYAYSNNPATGLRVYGGFAAVKAP